MKVDGPAVPTGSPIGVWVNVAAGRAKKDSPARFASQGKKEAVHQPLEADERLGGVKVKFPIESPWKISAPGIAESRAGAQYSGAKIASAFFSAFAFNFMARDSFHLFPYLVFDAKIDPSVLARQPTFY